MKKAPLLKKILQHIQKKTTSFHTPGHQQGSGFTKEFLNIMENYCLKMDLTEVPGLDNLRNPIGCINEAQGLAARTFGAYKTFFLVNGSTAGLHAALLAVNKTREKIIISRNSHISILNGLVLSGGLPVPLPVELDSKWGIPLGSLLDDIIIKTEENPDVPAVIITQPTYQGTGGNIGEITSGIRTHGRTLVIDEAHGAHLFFQDRTPLSAQKSGADIVVQSTHKTLPALTQASMLHVNNKKLVEPINRALGALQTTSPSYLLMASLDGVQCQMKENGPALLDNVLELADKLRSYVRELPGYRLFQDEIKPPWYYDPSKIVISAAEIGLTGWELAACLQEKYGIVVEMSDYYYVLFLLNIGHNACDITRVKNALHDIARHEKKQAVKPLENPGSFYKDKINPILTPREVFFKEKVQLFLDRVAGRICGKALTIYPPGIPLVWPGQVFRQEHIDYLKWAKGNGLQVQGISSGDRVFVIKEI